ncbi:tripartite motif-containing protein 63 [Mytilus galloprovincialis]|uniref:Tripartite motif-containing protein 63 n=1 Tax=Mytilus galloprovincialis TaxID=29158 RepID=A0A8B6GQE9_MYTGA|nr:tripartite motif-containing protein 63 [Mytilus galloprovincialis]
MSDMEAELMCGVCLEYFDKPLMLPCTHNFCRKCIEGILSVNSRPNIYGQLPRHRLKYHLDCPLCQRPIELDRGVESLTVNRILENIIALHRKDEPLASNDAAWKLDSSVSDSPCLLHNSEPMSLYCLTCNRAVCRSCDCVTDKSSGTIHKCVPIKEQADQYQMKISNAISEIKRKVVPVHDEMQLLQDMVEQIKVPMEGCFICKLSINDGRATVTLREKGARNINEFSKLRNDTKVAKSGDVVHQDCRRDYTNAKSVKQKELDYKTTENRVLRSQEQFNYRDNCLFCGQFADVKDKRKGTDVFPVRTKDFQSNIEKICPMQCKFSNRKKHSIHLEHLSRAKNKTGRPQHQQAQAAFQKTVEYLLQNEDEQLTVIELVEKMKDYCGDAAYSTVHMKSKIQKYFGDDKQNASDPESEKMNIIKAAASLIKSDIKSKIGTKTEYPSVSDVESLECNEHYLPDSLRLFLNSLISTCNHSLKLSAIGQTIIQATRPRSLIAPLQIGLAVQMHHHFGSRFLIDSLYNMGFSSSYSEVQRYEMNAAMSQGTDIPEVTEEGNLQYIADNVDHNLRTIDGHGTFHGMGIIASVTPGFMRTNCIPRTDVNIEELKEIGKIDIRPYKLDKETHTSLKFMKLNQVNATSYSESLSLLSRTVWPIKSTGWSALCQMVYGGVFPGKSSIVYLPMIDMNPSDLTCINSTLHFISKEARRHNADPVVTFDQPLYWKAVNIILNEAESSTLKSMVVRLGGFHTEMSFLGSIGHIMNSSGLSELLETVYASTAVGHMLSGKAISRAVRGHFLTQTALTLLITSEIYDFPQYTPGTDTDDPSQSYLDDKENFPKADTTCVDNEKPFRIEPNSTI